MNRILTLFLSAAFLVCAEDHGPDVRLTGAPGDLTCVACHTGTALNAGGGSVAVTASGGGSTYTPGVKQRLTITLTDGSATRYGFQLSARLVSNPASGQAGSLAAVDNNTQVRCESGRTAPCSSEAEVQFAEHTMTGYRAASRTFLVDWTPPGAASAGAVRLYVAGNAANGNGNNSGDHIYTSTLDLAPAGASAARPAISSTRGVVNAASFETAIAENTWITIAGTNLSATTRSWGAADFAGSQLPTSLDGVSVTVNNKPAYVQYISPTQINALAPADPALGQVEVKVVSGGQTSEAVTATLQALAPALFTFDGKAAAATHADGSILSKSSPAKPGETIVLFGTGFGPTSPAAGAGQITSQPGPLTNTPTVTMGGLAAPVVFGGLTPNFARLYQFNVTVPAAAPDGDLTVVIEAGGVSSPSTATVSVQK